MQSQPFREFISRQTCPQACGHCKERQWLSASRNSQSERRDKMYICKAMNSSIIIGTAQTNTVKKGTENKIIKEMNYRKLFLISQQR